MVIDTSALVAVILDEPDAAVYYSAMENSAGCLVSAASVVEASLVLLGRRSNGATELLDLLLSELEIKIVSFDERQALLAREAFRRYGKGRHSAGLNFGDCFSYALAKDTGQPLLFKGDDFSHTDLTRA